MDIVLATMWSVAATEIADRIVDLIKWVAGNRTRTVHVALLGAVITICIVVVVLVVKNRQLSCGSLTP